MTGGKNLIVNLTRDKDHGQCEDQGVYCGLSTPFEVFLIFTTQLYMHVYTIIVQHFSHFDTRELLQQGYSQPQILPSPHFQWVVNLTKTRILV